jgi:hypothetical protein
VDRNGFKFSKPSSSLPETKMGSFFSMGEKWVCLERVERENVDEFAIF